MSYCACTAFSLATRKLSNISSGLLDVPKAQTGLKLTALKQLNVYSEILHKTIDCFDKTRQPYHAYYIYFEGFAGSVVTVTNRCQHPYVCS